MHTQKGLVHILIVLILLAGLGATLYLSQHTQIFKPKAAGSTVSSSINYTPQSSPIPTVLQSNFFATDPVAIELVEQNLSRDIRVFEDASNPVAGHTNSRSIFEYKVISALRMLGMTIPKNLPGSGYLGEVLLNKFQRLHTLEQTPLITADVLKKIDSDLVIREQKDGELARRFPLYDRFTQSSPNQPTKEHVAALYTIAFQALPPHLVLWNEKWFENYLKLQYPATIVNSSHADWKICTGAGLMYGIPDPCPQSLQPYPGKSPDPQTGMKFVPLFDELNLVGTVLHEYAHFLDKNVWPGNDLVIETRGFYEISFKDFDPASYPSPTDLTKYYKRDVSQNRNEFVSGYAASNNFQEDFAESFTMYIMQGRTFRELAKQNEFLNQKYEWLKQNVFHGVEYDTGVYKEDTLRSVIGHPADYSLANPDFYFTYDFPKQNSITSFPSPTPTPSINPLPTPTPKIYPESPCAGTSDSQACPAGYVCRTSTSKNREAAPAGYCVPQSQTP